MKCTICGIEGLLGRCREHYRCDGCGTREDIMHRHGGVWCYECHCKQAAAEVVAFAAAGGDHRFTSEITCPWCGSEQGDSWEADEDGEQECENCEHSYKHQRNIEVTYCTEKVEA